MKNDVPLIDAKGIRLDGRKANELRPIKMEIGVLKRADGSCYLEWGNNKVMAAVYGPREVHPKHKQVSTKAIVQCRYSMAPFSVDERKRPGPDRRSMELSKVISECLEPAIHVGYFPKTSIDVFIEILQADAGTRCAGITAAAMALMDAGIPMKDFVVACAAGKVEDTIVLDLKKEEDMNGKADVPVAYMPNKERITLLQMDGELTTDEFKQAIKTAIDGCKRVWEIQKEVLRNKFSGEGL